MIGIYSIKNKANGKMYTGQSSDIENRWVKHINFLKNGKHHNKHLQAAWKFYGEENFEFSVIEECTEKELNQKEQYYIKLYDTYNSGYNLDFGGDGIRGYKHTEEQLEKMRLAHHTLVILQFDLNFNFVKRWIGGAVHAAKEMHFTSSCIKGRCSHGWNKMEPYKGYYWVYENEYTAPDFSWDNYLNDRNVYVDKFPLDKNIIQYDRKRNFIKSWGSLSELRNSGYNATLVKAVCDGTTRAITHDGYIWAYDGYDFSDGKYDLLNIPSEKVIEGWKKRSKKVFQYTENGELVAEYPSITIASKYVPSTISNLSNAIKRGKFYHGYFWKIA